MMKFSNANENKLCRTEVFKKELKIIISNSKKNAYQE